MQELQIAMIRIAQNEIGVEEEGGENKGERILEYMRASWMPEESNQKGYPWCAVFCGWVVREALMECDMDINDYYQGADAYGWEKWARSRGYEVLDENDLALPGDLVTFDFSHIGIVIEDHRDWIETVEGNTNADGDREGDGVYGKRRQRSLARHFIRLPGSVPL